MARTRNPLLAEILDLPPDEVPELAQPYLGAKVCTNNRTAKDEVRRLQNHPECPKTYNDACAHCQPREIEWLNLVLGGVDHTAAAAKVYDLGGRSAVNKGALLFGRMPRVMLALEIGRRELAKKVDYTFEKVMEDIDSAIQFAKDNNNPAAYKGAIEMKAKLTGHLGKDDARPEGTFQLHIHAG